MTAIQVEPMMRLPAVKSLTGAGKTTIYRWIKEGNFPRPVSTGPNSVAWRERDIAQWQQSLSETSQ